MAEASGTRLPACSSMSQELMSAYAGHGCVWKASEAATYMVRCMRSQEHLPMALWAMTLRTHAGQGPQMARALRSSGAAATRQLGSALAAALGKEFVRVEEGGPGGGPVLHAGEACTKAPGAGPAACMLCGLCPHLRRCMCAPHDCLWMLLLFCRAREAA